MNRSQMAWFILFFLVCGFVAGFAAAMLVAGDTNWECWGDGNDC